MENKAYVWAIDRTDEVLVTDDPGPLAHGRFIGSYDLPESGGWGEAQKVAEQVANHDPARPYEIVYDADRTMGELHDDTCDCDKCCGDDVEYEDEHEAL